MECINESSPGSCDLDGEPCSKGNCESFADKNENKFTPKVITNLRNCDMSKMHDQFLARIEKIFPDATEVQKTHAMFAAVQIYWMLEGWDE